MTCLPAARNLFVVSALISLSACAINPIELPGGNNVVKKSLTGTVSADTPCGIEDIEGSYVQGSETGIQIYWLAKKSCQLFIEKQVVQAGATWETGISVAAIQEYFLFENVSPGSNYKIRISEAADASRSETFFVNVPASGSNSGGGGSGGNSGGSGSGGNSGGSGSGGNSGGSGSGGNSGGSGSGGNSGGSGSGGNSGGSGSGGNSGGGGSGGNSGGPQMTVNRDLLAFGSKPLGVTYTWPVSIQIANTGTTHLILKLKRPEETAFTFEYTSTCMDGQALPIGYSCYILVNFTPTERRNYSGVIEISDYGGLPIHRVNLTGSVYTLDQDTPRISVDNQTLEFGDHPVGSNTTYMVVVRNAWSAPAQLVLGNFPPGYSLVPGTYNTCKHELKNPGDTCSFFIGYYRHQAGRADGTLEIRYSNGSIQGIPLVLSLRGSAQ